MRIGILGTNFGKVHAEFYNKFQDVEIDGIVGRDKPKTLAVAESLGIDGFTDPNDIILNPNIDAIDICFPTELHAQYAVAALSQGKHVFCETPVSYNLNDTDRMARAATDNGKLLLVALFSRFVSDYKFIYEKVLSGDIGGPKVIFANRRTPPIWGSSWDENFVFELMLHDIDYIYWLLGKPHTVSSIGLRNSEEGWRHAVVTLDYGDANAIVEGCGMMPSSFPFSTNLRVVGEDAAIELNWYWAGEYPLSEAKFYPNNSEPEILSVPGYDPYEAECRYFVDCVQGKVDPELLSIETARESLHIAVAAKQSLEEKGKRIVLE